MDAGHPPGSTHPPRRPHAPGRPHQNQRVGAAAGRGPQGKGAKQLTCGEQPGAASFPIPLRSPPPRGTGPLTFILRPLLLLIHLRVVPGVHLLLQGLQLALVVLAQKRGWWLHVEACPSSPALPPGPGPRAPGPAPAQRASPPSPAPPLGPSPSGLERPPPSPASAAPGGRWPPRAPGGTGPPAPAACESVRG